MDDNEGQQPDLGPAWRPEDEDAVNSVDGNLEDRAAETGAPENPDGHAAETGGAPENLQGNAAEASGAPGSSRR